MKKMYFCLLLGMLTIAFTACEKKVELGTTIVGKEVLTDKYFPEPCFDWWTSSETVKAQMLEKGYKLVGEEKDYDMLFLKFSYHLLNVQCMFVYDEYFWFEIEGLSDSAIKEIKTNYSRSKKYTKNYEKNVEGKAGDFLATLFTSADGKMFVYFEESDSYKGISYGPTDYPEYEYFLNLE